jgi:DNA (cytosine-5)-methyltransferase 1
VRHGSLFSGIGGFDLAAAWMGWENVFQCEKDPFCRMVLQHYWPETVCYEDARDFKGDQYSGGIDVLSGGFPCQPFSVAGKRKRTGDDRYLWPEMCRIIGEVRPRWILGENVHGLLDWSKGLVFEQVQADLEAQGYQVWAYVLPAAGVGAPHRRDRVWIVAYAGGSTWSAGFKRKGGMPGWKGEPLWGESGTIGEGGFVADADGDGCFRYTDPSRLNDKGVQQRLEEGHGFDELPRHGDAADADSIKRHEGGVCPAGSEKTERYPGARSTWGYGNPWQDFPTQSPICTRDDGISSGLDGIAFSKWRKESIRAAGNAIVPQVAFRIFRSIEIMEAELNTSD